MKIEIDVDETYSDTAIVIHTPRLTPDTEKLISLIRMLNMQVAVKRDGETHLLDTEKILYSEMLHRYESLKVAQYEVNSYLSR